MPALPSRVKPTTALESAVPTLHLLVAGAIAGVAANVTGYLITGLLFHRYQAITPQVWRATESWTHYSYAAAVRIAAACAIGFLYSAIMATSPVFGPAAIARGTEFGSVLWALIILPVVLELALFVNWHRFFVVGPAFRRPSPRPSCTANVSTVD
jgi:hypothetical protein